jgi:hypothetical protein
MFDRLRRVGSSSGSIASGSGTPTAAAAGAAGVQVQQQQQQLSGQQQSSRLSKVTGMLSTASRNSCPHLGALQHNRQPHASRQLD